MAHFAYCPGGIVQRIEVVNNDVICDQNGIEQEAIGQAFLAGLHDTNPADHVQTSYNGNPIAGQDRGPLALPGDLWDGEKFTRPADVPAP